MKLSNGINFSLQILTVSDSRNCTFY